MDDPALDRCGQASDNYRPNHDACATFYYDGKTSRLAKVWHWPRDARAGMEMYRDDPRLDDLAPRRLTQPQGGHIPAPTYAWLGLALIVATAALTGCGVGLLLCP